MMRAIADKPEVEEQPVLSQGTSEARISLRAVTALEIASVIVSVLITTWAVIPYQPRQRWLAAVPGLLAMAMMFNSHRVRRESLRELGFTTQHFGHAMRLLLLPTLAACAAFTGIGYLTHSFHLNTHFWSNLFFLPLWGLTQQYVLQGFIYRRLRSLLVEENDPPTDQSRQVRLTIMVTALLFALVHAPNPALMFFTMLGALLWSWVYQRAPNLFALGISHAVISLMLMTSLPPWLLQSMSVGYKHFLYQKF